MRKQFLDYILPKRIVINSHLLPHLHPGRIALYRRIKKPLHLGEIDNLIKLTLDLFPPHPQDSPIQKDILPPGQLRMKPGPNLQQTRHPPGDLNLAAGRLGYPAEDFQQGGLPGAVAADDADPVALFYLETDVAEGVKVFL